MRDWTRDNKKSSIGLQNIQIKRNLNMNVDPIRVMNDLLIVMTHYSVIVALMKINDIIIIII